LTSKPSVICLATRRYDDAMPTIVQHLMGALGRRVNILYIEPPVDAVYLFRQRSRRILHPLPGPDHIRRVVPMVLPFGSRWTLLRRLNRRLLIARIRSLAVEFGTGRDVLWIPNPNFDWIAESLPDLPVCYYISDDYTAAPALLAESSPEDIAAKHDRLIERAKWVLVNSPVLLEKNRHRHGGMHWVPNGVDLDHYRASSAGRPADLETIRKPIVGFIGAMDAYKVDFDLLAACARRLTNCSFVSVGPIGWARGKELIAVPEGDNIYHLGRRPYDDLPGYLREFDVAILPNRTDGYMASNFPMKLFEYFAAELPVVATDIPSLRPFAPFVGVATSLEEFEREIRLQLGSRDTSRCRRALQIAENNTWARQAERVLSVLRGEEPAPVIPPSLAR
jgi:glycosyltransferase involved in cell wall biosynthesis